MSKTSAYVWDASGTLTVAGHDVSGGNLVAGDFTFDFTALLGGAETFVDPKYRPPQDQGLSSLNATHNVDTVFNMTTAQIKDNLHADHAVAVVIDVMPGDAKNVEVYEVTPGDHLSVIGVFTAPATAAEELTHFGNYLI